MVNFDRNEFELRGTIPRFLPPDKATNVEEVTDRVESQISWLAQLLGHSGTNYWPREKLTLQEKRSTIKGTYGLYDRAELPFEQRGFPENRSEILVSGDKEFRVSNSGTRIIPSGLDVDLEYSENIIFRGALYTFEGNLPVNQGNPSFYEYDCAEDVTRVKFDALGTVQVGNVWLTVMDWNYVSDWIGQEDNFTGLWSQKGGFFPLHYVFDAWNLHGYNDRCLFLDPVSIPLRIVSLCPIILTNPSQLPPVSNFVSPSNIILRIQFDCNPGQIFLTEGDSEILCGWNFSLDNSYVLTAELQSIDDNCDLTGSNLVVDAIYEPDFDNGIYDNTADLDYYVDSGIYDTTFTCSLDEGTYDPLPLPPFIEFNISGFDSFDFSISQNSSCFFAPDVRNALTPLRLWRNNDLQIDDTNGDFIYKNPAYADVNKGVANPEDPYRFFVRLPPSYPRDGKKWTLAKLATQNLSYAGKESSIQVTDKYVTPSRPKNYDEFEDEFFEDRFIFYQEDYLSSFFSKKDNGEMFDWDNAEIVPDFDELDLTYDSFTLIEYDPFCSRIPIEGGEWQGKYYVADSRFGKIRGNIDLDIADNRISEISAPKFDASEFKYPRLSDDYLSNKVDSKDYRVCYAYFAADLSAVGEPIFDPLVSISRRPEALGDPSRSNYIQHPV